MLDRKKGQNINEYAVLMAIVIAAVIGSSLYFQRALKGKQKDAIDTAVGVIIQAAGPGASTPLQYEPYYSISEVTKESDSTSNVTYSQGATLGIYNTTSRTLSGTSSTLSNLSQY